MPHPEILVELLMRIELTTSSLPRKCSTTELQQHQSGRPTYAFTSVGRCDLSRKSTLIKFYTLNVIQDMQAGDEARTPACWQAGATLVANPHYNLFSMHRTSFGTTSGRRGSNPRPAAWKAAALPTELLPPI